MNRRLKLAMAALLGFSTACSSVKNAPAKGDDKPQADSTEVRTGDDMPRIVVMYGVRRPMPLVEDAQQQGNDTSAAADDNAPAKASDEGSSEAETPAEAGKGVSNSK